MLVEMEFLGRASGSVGSLVFSHNAGGPYIRSKGMTTNPNTPQQQTVRALLAQLTSLWVSTLSAAERGKWTDYAANVQLPNRLGAMRNVSGLNMYVRSNIPLIQAGFARQDVAPSIFDLGDFTAPVGVGIDATQVLTITFTDTDAWVGENDAGMLIYISRQQNESVNFFKGPYQFAGSIDGDATTPPTTPASIPVPFAINADNRLFFRAQVVRADGRLSSDVKLPAIIV